MSSLNFDYDGTDCDSDSSPARGDLEVSFSQQDEVATRLREFIAPRHVKSRKISRNRSLTVMSTEASLAQAKSVFGSNGYSTKVQSCTMEETTQSERDGAWSIAHSATVAVILKDGTRHEDVGFHQAEGFDRFVVHMRSKEGAIADARKRALRVFGNATGNCLYNAKAYSKHIEDERWRRAESEDAARHERDSRTAQLAAALREREADALAARAAHERTRKRWRVGSNARSTAIANVVAAAAPPSDAQRARLVALAARCPKGTELRVSPVAPNRPEGARAVADDGGYAVYFASADARGSSASGAASQDTSGASGVGAC